MLLVPIAERLPRELLADLRLLYGLPDYQLLAEQQEVAAALDVLPPEEWRRTMEEPPKPGTSEA